MVKVVNDNKVETGLAGGGAAATNAGGGGGRRFSRARNPKNILAVVAAEASLGIPTAFKELVSSMRKLTVALVDRTVSTSSSD